MLSSLFKQAGRLCHNKDPDKAGKRDNEEKRHPKFSYRRKKLFSTNCPKQLNLEIPTAKHKTEVQFFYMCNFIKLHLPARQVNRHHSVQRDLRSRSVGAVLSLQGFTFSVCPPCSRLEASGDLQ